MNRLLLVPLVCLIMAVSGGEATAIHRCGSHCVKCPSCNQGCCKLDVSEGKVKKTYWTIETEQICVPNFVFSWQNCGLKSLLGCGCGTKGCSGGCSGGGCGHAGCSGGCSRCKRPNHNGGRVKTIRVLKKHSYECPVCLYKWSAEGGGNRGCSNGCSGKCSCDSAAQNGDAGAQEPEPEDSPEPPSSEPSVEDGSDSAPQQAPIEPELGNEPSIEEAIPSEAPKLDASTVVPQSYNRRLATPPEPGGDLSIVDPFTRRILGNK